MTWVERLKKHRKLWTLARVVKEFRTENFQKLIWGYYDNAPEATAFMIEHPGERDPDQIVLYATRGEQGSDYSGFFALLRAALEHINLAEHLGYKPVLVYGEGTFYYDYGMDDKTKNAFDYYFEPVSEIKYEEINQYKNVIKIYNREGEMLLGKCSYWIDDDEIQQLADLYRRYIRLNEETRQYFEKEIGTVLNGEKTLGVHVRGANFYWGARSHPVAVLPPEYVKKVKEVFAAGNYKRIFLATDDLHALDLFKQEFDAGELVFYTDVVRSDSHLGAYEKELPRPLHRYRLGLEVLRDAYTLAYCDGLIAGLSQVSFAARYIGLAMERHYEDCVILDKGIIKEHSKEALEAYKRQSRESKKKHVKTVNEHGKNTKK